MSALQFADAQQITLQGQVSILNSGYHNHGKVKYVDNAAISAPKGGSDITDAKGNFALTFVGLDTGTTVAITVSKHGYVVVNARDLQAIDLGRKSPLQIYLADSLALLQEQALLYDINLKVLTAEKDALIARLKSDSSTSRSTIAELQVRFDQEFEHRWAAEDYLNAQLEEAKSRLPERVAELARVNLDIASERYRQAYAAMHAGKTDLVFGFLEGLEVEAIELEQHMDALGADSLRYHTVSDSIDQSARQVVDCYRLKAEAYNLRFEYRKTAEVLEKGWALLLRVKRGEEDLEVADACGHLGRAYKNLGDYSTELAYQKKNLSIAKSFLNDEDLNLAFAYNDMAMSLYDVGEYSSALSDMMRAIQIKQGLMEPTDLSLAVSYSNLSSIFHAIGDYQKSINAIETSIAIREEKLEPNEPELAMSYNNLSTILQDMGDYSNALKAQEKAISIVELELVSNHPNLAIFYGNLATIYFLKGNLAKSIELQEKTILIQEKTLGPYHPAVATSYNNLANALLDLGKYSSALEAQQKATSIREVTLGLNHPILATSYNNQAAILQAMGNYPNAFFFVTKAISILEITPDLNLPMLATSYTNLANIQEYLGEYQLALEAQEKAISIQEKMSPINHIDLAISYNNLATILQDLHNYTLAMSVQRKAISMMEEFHEPNHPDIVFAYSNLATILEEMGEYAKALEAGQKALSLQKMLVAPTHQNLAGLYHNVGSLFFRLYNLDSAVIYKEAAFDIWVKTLPPQHPYLATVKSDLSLIYELIGGRYYDSDSFQLGKVTYQKSINFGNNSFAVYNSLGVCQYFLAEYDSAITSFQMANRLNSGMVKVYLNNIGLAYARQGNLNEAKSCFQKLDILSPNEPSPYRAWSIFYALKDDHEAALTNLENAIQLGYTDLSWIKTESAFDALRNHPRYISLIKSLEEKQK